MRKAFTLIETIVAAAISLVTVSAIFIAAFSLIRSWKTVDSITDSLESARNSLTRISSDTRNSEGVGSSSTGNTLVLDCGGDVVSYDLNEGKVRRKVNSSSSYLTEAGRVSNLKFSYPSAKLVSVTMGISVGPRVEVITTECFVRD